MISALFVLKLACDSFTEASPPTEPPLPHAAELTCPQPALLELCRRLWRRMMMHRPATAVGHTNLVTTRCLHVLHWRPR
jgi:hypothetical protein